MMLARGLECLWNFHRSIIPGEFIDKTLINSLNFKHD